MIKITLTSTGSQIPDPHSVGPSTLVQCAGQNILIDCGRSVTTHLMATGIPVPFLSAILVSHLQSDYITDLIDLVTTRWILTPEAMSGVFFSPVGQKKLSTEWCRC